jgi:hypothetical protein
MNFPTVRLTEAQRSMLRVNANTKRDFSKPNKKLEEAIEQVKAQNPTAFLSPEDLPKRKFVHAPVRPIPYESAVTK